MHIREIQSNANLLSIQTLTSRCSNHTKSCTLAADDGKRRQYITNITQEEIHSEIKKEVFQKKKKYVLRMRHQNSNRFVQRQSMLVKQVVPNNQLVKEVINVILFIEQKIQSSHTKQAKPRQHLVHVQHYDPEDQLQYETSHHNHEEDK